MTVFLWVLLGLLIAALAVLGQCYRVLYQTALEYAVEQERWIDDIIKALEREDETEGDEAIDYLIAAKRPPKGPLV